MVKSTHTESRLHRMCIQPRGLGAQRFSGKDKSINSIEGRVSQVIRCLYRLYVVYIKQNNFGIVICLLSPSPNSHNIVEADPVLDDLVSAGMRI